MEEDDDFRDLQPRVRFDNDVCALEPLTFGKDVLPSTVERKIGEHGKDDACRLTVSVSSIDFKEGRIVARYQRFVMLTLNRCIRSAEMRFEVM